MAIYQSPPLVCRIRYSLDDTLIATLALTAFEICITAQQEVDVIWRRKWTLITWLYSFTRYGELLAGILMFTADAGYMVRRFACFHELF